MNDGMPRIVSVALLQPAAELLAQEPMAYYREDLRGPDGWDTSPLYLTEFASGEDLKPTMTGGPIVLRYQDRNCPVELPAGRQFMAGLAGPVVDRSSMIFPMEPMTLAEARQMLAQVVGQFDQGWSRIGTVREGLTEEDFTSDTGPKSARVGQWRQCGNGPAKAEITVEHYNSASGSSFTPPATLSAPLPEDAGDRFLIRVNFTLATQTLSRKASELVMSRRAAEGLDPAFQQLPAGIWLDNPDWRPAGWDGGF
ncbi:hypothetical protein [Paracoccus siganidrum]|uniref:Uncharacterized protein n=1 Tax=Paracoccus siganidrum TaxID=1276757 RepID=A0A418ZVL3_9RHOB|nr:hypothetical protein [Paracoccus siganidrum]RJL02855.1 hypothetical protein D3P05_21595 [Paracoccus siganidrum]RMC25554.1 hypothetical protein C9E82_23090 [Paracoccus siganidrum]